MVGCVVHSRLDPGAVSAVKREEYSVSTIASRFGLNASYVQALRAQWERDPSSVAYEWQTYFQNGGTVASETPAATEPKVETKAPAKSAKKSAPVAKSTPGVIEAAYTKPLESDVVEPIRGIAAIIAENMEASLGIPTAMSTRRVPMKVLEENRRIINSFLMNDARKRASYTHLIAWALVRAAREVPSMNNGYTVVDDKPVKLSRADVNLGLAVDLPGRDGSRTLVVPNIKATNKLDFKQFLAEYNKLINKARKSKLTPADFQGTTITLTNPGGLGTIASAPRLMPGQGTIIATGAIGYPAEYEATSPETLRALGIGKSVTMTSTYDHRVIQGAESGRYLKFVHELLNGHHDFYDEVFRALGIPHHPYRLEKDQAGVGTSVRSRATEVDRAMQVSQLIHAYRVRGHLLANVDPLDLQPRDHPELNFETYGLTIWDLDREFSTMGVLEKETATFREILTKLRDVYCRRTGIEYMYMPDVEQKKWMQERVERDETDLELEEKRGILRQLSRAQGFERFLHKRYMGHKRFSVEGAESIIPMLDEVLAQSASYGASDAIIGMAHRGRLNVLANVMGKSYEAIFAEFDDINLKTVHGSGDVKYHLGAKSRYRFRGQTSDLGVVEERELRVELACNPSHLEAVNPVVLGQCRARQDLTGDKAREKVVPILIHGDAAFAGQGVVYETMQLSYLQGYRVGGAIHIVINNQIGYTTGPERARTSPNCSDIARVIMAPIFRVNGDDPEACIRAVRMAVDYRMRFHRDVVIDMVCYRKYGHNEGDEPGFTQPILYRAIRDHDSVAERYSALLLRRKDLAQEDVDQIEKDTYDALEQAFGAVKERGEDAVPEKEPMRPGEYDEDAEEEPDTRASMEVLDTCVDRITKVPEHLNVHPRLKKNVLDRRREMWVDRKYNVDVGLAENLAYATLLAEGIPVRITGQDCGRGTFAHRHGILYDYDTGDAYVPLDNLDKHRAEGDIELAPSRFRIYDSFLSEEAVLGFEYGYSVTHPDSLVIWEAQFGDFFNGAQIQVDQFIVAGEAKWGQQSRVTMLLPHGYDGQGPEHSSARVERFLQMCAQDNIRVAICSTPAQFFHLLRRQAKQPKRPLVVFTHKSLLRADDAGSKPEELAEGKFNVVLDDIVKSEGKKKRVVLCTGKFFWDLHRERQKRQEAGQDMSDIAIVRVEQLYPFPGNAIAQVVERYSPDEVMWAQEEPRNMGAWDFMVPRFKRFGLEDVSFVGRPNAASPATGSKRRHTLEQAALVNEALTLKS